MSTISITHLYALLSEKVGKETAESLTTYIEEKIEKDVANETRHLATKEDLVATREQLERGFKDQARWLLGVCITLVIMILGLYAAIFLKR